VRDHVFSRTDEVREAIGQLPREVRRGEIQLGISRNGVGRGQVANTLSATRELELTVGYLSFARTRASQTPNESEPNAERDR
jgi:hypothetical protein